MKNLGNLAWALFSKAVSLGMSIIPRTTVWAAELAFFIAPKLLRHWVERYTSERILACVVSGKLPLLPHLNGGDAVLFYPLPQCTRYELEGYRELEPQSLFGGAIYAFVIPPLRRADHYRLSGVGKDGKRYDAGRLRSRGQSASTLMGSGVSFANGRIRWPVRSRRYLTSFVLIYHGDKAKAAGYSRRRRWPYPSTAYLPHVVIPPQTAALDASQDGLLIMIVDTDAWVPHVLMHPAPSASPPA